MSHRARHTLPRFLIVGAVGFLVDAGLLFLLTSMGGDPYLTRILSFSVAVVVTWAGSQYWTFSDQKTGSISARFLKYFGIQSFGMAVNYLTFAAVLWVLSPTPLNAVLATMAGSLIALAVNFAGVSKYVFKDTSHA
ncbi:Putative flippase GtrA (transmembrane translocase of bactoprenol-linked glucose) [Shimia gijangensis]|uniref:Putative flippase GtrA (Transmembrane translocase of bactoprenol-linked glucose) n=1 Tax=Shimia gijangensis TaxID=1470563 RepID=A0A1M6QJ80_9RHOB|nr:GtrA family protein [Shimia gijangensis]SHK20292.1 Putative flippase GtrA (transmembrane translocase of bactoprenol-linked glucose) [Shimia gijangensis]